MPLDSSSPTDGPHQKAFRLLREARGGNAAAVFAFASIALVGATGLGIDYTRVRSATEEIRERLDAALVAGAGKEGRERVEVAEAVFDQNVTGSVAKVASRRFTSRSDGISGEVSAEVPTTLSSVIGIRTVRVTARGNASAPFNGASCVLVASTSGADTFVEAEGQAGVPVCERASEADGRLTD